MRKYTYLTLFSSISLLGLVSGCANHQSKTPISSQSPSVISYTSNVINNDTSSKHTDPLKISATNKTRSQVVFTFNQPIEDVHVTSGKTSLLIGKTADSVTFQRSKSSNQTVTVLITEASGKTAHLTLQVPKTITVPKTSSHNTSPSTKTADLKNPTVPSGKAAPVIYFGPSSGRRIYITVDDGWFPNQRVLQLMQQKHVPITAFLIQKAAAEHLNYWKAFVKAGGVIQDHTVNHPWLTKVSFQDDISEWAGPVQTFPKWFGQTPTLGRPPYGAVDKAVQIAANKVGLKYIVMWSAAFDPSDPSKGLQTWNNKPLSPGEIVILHWQPGVYNEIQDVLTICKKRGLVPAPLVLGQSQTNTTSTVYGKSNDASTNTTNQRVSSAATNKTSSTATHRTTNTAKNTTSDTNNAASTASNTIGGNTAKPTSSTTSTASAILSVSKPLSGQYFQPGGTIQVSGKVNGVTNFSGHTVIVTLYSGQKALNQFMVYDQVFSVQSNGTFSGTFQVPNESFIGAGGGTFIMTFQADYPGSPIQTVPMTIPAVKA